MKKIDKKQLPQLIALIALSVGVFGFFIFRMIAPTPAAAQSPAIAKAADAAKKITGAVVDAAAAVPAPAPTAGMRDPFLPGVADASALDVYQKAQASAAAPQQAAPRTPAGRRSARQAYSSAPITLPPGMPLPTMGGAPLTVAGGNKPMPVAAPPAAPVTWSVTGVLGGDGGVAILRDGESRRIVKQGDVLDGGLRVRHIGRGSVTLERDGQNYRLPLGGSKDAPKAGDAPAKAPAPDAAPMSFAAPAPGDAQGVGETPAQPTAP